MAEKLCGYWTEQAIICGGVLMVRRHDGLTPGFLAMLSLPPPMKKSICFGPVATVEEAFAGLEAAVLEEAAAARLKNSGL